ncbi:BTAD domain-containing putative transcriptional regulator [Nonomuraea sp. NPDC050643]|uniref:AfsR/SARP family transcriptional regulator n=1 Tax=Nonomuraea sp. NPDC050643 TaxID=3155660 RepID=UPI0034078FBB
MLMVLTTALIGRLRPWSAQAGASSFAAGLFGGAACPRGIDGRNGEEIEASSAVVLSFAEVQAPTVTCGMAESVAKRDRGEHMAATPSQPDQPGFRSAVSEAETEAEVPLVSSVLARLGSGFVAAAGKAKVEVLGVPRLSYGGAEVCFGRAEARELLALLAVSRDGVSAEGIAETLWPGEVGGRRLDSAVREINRAMRQAVGCASGIRFVLKSGERRLLPAAAFDADFWRFEDACKLASIAVEDAVRVAALHEVLALYRGPLLAGRDDLWVLPLRQAAQRQAADAAERMAELVRADDPGRAVDVLRLAVECIDPYSETLWCLLMSVQGELGRLPAVRRSFELLRERLAEIDAVPSPQARQVYERFVR